MSSLSTLISGGGGGIESIQFITHSGSSGNRTVSISSVDTSKSYFNAVGHASYSSTQANYNFHFDSSTQVGYRASSQYATAYFMVIEYA